MKALDAVQENEKGQLAGYAEFYGYESVPVTFLAYLLVNTN